MKETLLESIRLLNQRLTRWRVTKHETEALVECLKILEKLESGESVNIRRTTEKRMPNFA